MSNWFDHLSSVLVQDNFVRLTRRICSGVKYSGTVFIVVYYKWRDITCSWSWLHIEQTSIKPTKLNMIVEINILHPVADPLIPIAQDLLLQTFPATYPKIPLALLPLQR